MSTISSDIAYEGFGIQSDGQSVVFDRCGNYGYLNKKKVRIIIAL
jgi:hypothetical protein